MTDADMYELSLYEPLSVIKESDDSVVEVVKHSVNDKKYIKKTYYSDKREIFNAISQIKSPHLEHVEKIYFGSETIVIEEYIEGMLLSEALKEKRISDAGHIIDNIISAVDTLHKNNIIHRDIKPSNVIVKNDGNAILLDYGIARFYSDKKEKDTEYFGTIGYAPPEQFGYSQSDFRTDIYALGKTITTIAESVKVPKLYLKIAQKCVSFDPEGRFQCVEEIHRFITKNKRARICGTFCLAVFLILMVTVSMFISSKQGNVQAVKKDYVSRIVDLSQTNEHINCVPIDNDISLVSFELNNSVVEANVEKISNGMNLTIGGTEFSFIYSIIFHTNDYPNTSLMYEIILYDLNNDGIEEIIPIICDGCYMDDNEDIVLQNGAMGWCIYTDEDGNYHQAKGCMESILDPFRIYEKTPGLIWGDFPVFYQLIGDEIVKGEW